MVNESHQRYRAEPISSVAGHISVPGDKSISHRALMMAAIADGRSTVTGFLRGEDCLATLTAIRHLGVQVEDFGDRIQIDGAGLHGLRPATSALDLGNSGTAMRLMAGLMAGQHFDSVLTGDASLLSRPMARIAEPLRMMGAEVLTDEGRPPITINGGRALQGIDYRMPIASAQVKSAILLAGLYADGKTTVRSPGVTRDHTERMLSSMGATVDLDDQGNTAAITPVEALRAIELSVPGDFSSAAFFIVAACIGAPDGLLIENVGINPTRTGLIDILVAMGGSIDIRRRRTVGAEPVADLFVRQSTLRGLDVPPELVPLAIDEFPILFVAAAAAEGVTRVSGAQELRHKESDRLAVMATALQALGATVHETEDGMTVHGGRLRGGVVDSHGDHRIAMALVIASLLADAEIEILNTTQVATSFPDFVNVALDVGLELEAASEEPR